MSWPLPQSLDGWGEPMIACSQEHRAVIECSCVLVCVCVRMLILILACGAGGLQVSNSSAIFRGHINSAVGSLGVCQLESLPPPCPLPLALQHLRPPTPTPRPSPESLLLLLQARCIPPLPPSIPGSRSPPGQATQSLTLADWLWPGLGSSGREGPGEREGNRGGAAASAILSR